MKKQILVSILILASVLVSLSLAQDPGWPRQKSLPAGQLVYYQPQVDEWKDFKDLTFRMAFSLTPAGSTAVVGVATIHALTDVSVDNRSVFMRDLVVRGTSFPSLDPATAKKMDQLARTFLAPGHTVTMSLERLVACVPKPSKAAGVQVKNDPPQLFVSYGPTILLQLDGPPVRAEIPKTKLEFVVNSNWPLFFDKSGAKYYLFIDSQWLTATSLEGTWAFTNTLPKEMSKLPEDPQWAPLKKGIPPPVGAGSTVPKVLYSTRPAEVILIKGKPIYVKIPGTRLTYISNTDCDLFVYAPTTAYYYLAAGRWFRAASLEGPWTFASADLPPDFAQIPRNSPAARVLVSVPGTEDAKDAVLLAQIPTTIEVDPIKAAAQAKVAYNGSPEFKPIEGTTLAYATNTTDKVIKVGDVYYLCLQGVWFMSTTAEGPWKTASSIPKEIYTIPPSSPVYNVTYVTQTTTPSGSVQSSYTAGYMGAFVVGVAMGAVIYGGTGYYYPPYYYHPPYGYPIYHPYPATYGVGAAYNPYTGAYGVSRGVYGPYGGAAAGAAYNPYTGTYARGATAYGPYGSASAGRAYNPYTGTYAQGARVSTPYGSAAGGSAYNPYTGNAAATRQGSSPYGQWGSSVVAGQNQAVATQHMTTAQGSAARAQSTSGAKAAGISTASGSAYAGKSASGDMYAGKDGNVYKKDSSGSWQQYDNGSWNSVEKPTPTTAQQQQAQSARTNAEAQAQSSSANRANTQQRAQTTNSSSTGSFSRPEGQSSQVQGLNQEYQNRQRGSAQSQQWQNSLRSSSSGGGTSRSGGGGRRR